MIEKVIIMGAAGRDFHNFNVYFRGNTRYNVIAFTAAQIPNIENRRYPPKLAGSLYPDGIPIYPEKEIVSLIKEHDIDLVSFSYSDISHVDVMHKASMVNAAGADFVMIAAPYTMLKYLNYCFFMGSAFPVSGHCRASYAGISSPWPLRRCVY